MKSLDRILGMGTNTLMVRGRMRWIWAVGSLPGVVHLKIETTNFTTSNLESSSLLNIYFLNRRIDFRKTTC